MWRKNRPRRRRLNFQFVSRVVCPTNLPASVTYRSWASRETPGVTGLAFTASPAPGRGCVPTSSASTSPATAPTITVLRFYRNRRCHPSVTSKWALTERWHFTISNRQSLGIFSVRRVCSGRRGGLESTCVEGAALSCYHTGSALKPN